MTGAARARLFSRRSAPVADRLELASRFPFGPARRAREFVADLVEEGDVLHRAAQVPVGAPGVARLMIALAGIGIDPRLSSFAAALDKVRRAGDSPTQQDGNAALEIGRAPG